MLLKHLAIRLTTKYVNLIDESDADIHKSTVPVLIDGKPATMHLFPEQFFKKQNINSNGKKSLQVEGRPARR